MELGLILSFLGASILLSLMPGPDNVFVLTESITKGHRNGVAISAGLCIGVLIHTLATATGLSIVIQQSTVLFSIIKYLGAAYLLYLAYLSMKEKQPHLDIGAKVMHDHVPIVSLVRKGFYMNVLNPKVSLFFIAFLPQFVTTNGINITVQMIILGIIFMIQALIVFSSIALLSARLTGYVNSPKFWNITKWSKVGILVLLALSLAVTQK